MGSIVWLVLLGNGFSLAATWTPSGSLSAGAGHQDDQLLVDDPTGVVIPGGAFFESRAKGFLSRQTGDHVVRLGGIGSWTRFTDAQGRRLLSGTFLGEYRKRLDDRWHLRLGATAGGFDDAYRPEVQSLYGTASVSLGLSGTNWSLETGGGPQHLRYPAFPILTDDGVDDVLTENSLAWRSSLVLKLSRGVYGRLDARLLKTTAASSFFDAESRALDATIWLPVTAKGRIILGASNQRRDYIHRDTGTDQDHWRQLGMTFEHDLGQTLQAIFDFSVGDYQGVSGESSTTTRFALRLSKGFGSAGIKQTRISSLPPAALADKPIVFHLLDASANTVALIGDFNGWDPEADPLRPVGNGRWELAKLLPAGVWQYSYLVDGAAVEPTDAPYLIADGFGGRNGVITVLKKSVTSNKQLRHSEQRDRLKEPSADHDDHQENES